MAQLVGEAQRQGLSAEGEDGLLGQLAKLVLESAVEGEITAHLGYDKHESGPRAPLAATPATARAPRPS